MNLEATVLHGVAAHCNHIFYQIFLRVIICEFSLRISYGDCNRTARACV